MSRLRAGLDKLEASKRGLSDVYKEDASGKWVATDSVRATGLLPFEPPSEDSFLKAKVALDIASLAMLAGRDLAHDVAEKTLKKLAKDLEDEHFKKRERMLDMGEEMPESVIMTTNQPCKLTVLYENGAYRVLPFIGGEVFNAVGSGLSKSGKQLVYATPELEISHDKHGKVTRIEVNMKQEGELFNTKKKFKITAESEEQAMKIKNAINDKLVVQQSKQDAAKERMNKDEVFGSW